MTTSGEAAREQVWVWLREQRETDGGRLTQQRAQALAASSFLQRRSKLVQCAAADLFWAWAGEEAVEVTRRERGHHHLEVPGAAVLARSRVEGVSTEEAWNVTVEGRVLRALRDAAISEGEMVSPEETVQVTAGVMLRGWPAVKGSFTGPGGYHRYKLVIVALLLKGECEGTLDSDPSVGTWWAKAVEDVRRKGGAPPGRSGGFASRTKRPVVGECGSVGLDFGAGTQSARVLIEGLQLLYIPIDLKRWVYSARLGEWVENVVLDLSKVSGGPVAVWRQIRKAVKKQWSLDLGAQLVTIQLIWLSPPCRTFTNVDASNRLLGFGYRDHKKAHRPPLQGEDTMYGKIARQDDELMQHWMNTAALWSLACPGLVWFLENPMGSLERRPYMVRFCETQNVVRRDLDYCSYGRPYRKSTRIWTNARQWVPSGRSGNGRCPGKGLCPQMEGPRHRRSVAGGSRRVTGKGSVAGKSAVPRQLMLELVEAVQWRQGGLLQVVQ